MAAGLASATGLLQVSTRHTGVRPDTVNLRALVADRRVQACGFRAAAKPGVVDFFQLGRELAAPGRQVAQPSGGVALTALHQRQIDAIRMRRHVGGAAQAHALRFRREVGHHAPQFAQPQLQPQVHQRLRMLIGRRPPRPRHQHQQCVQDLARQGPGGGRQRRLEILRQLLVPHHPALEQLEQVDKQLVPLEAIPQLKPPGHVVDVRRNRLIGKEHRKPARHCLGGRGKSRVVQHGRQIGPVLEHVHHHRVFKEHPDGLAVFRDHRFRRKRHPENLPCVVPQGRSVRKTTQRGRRPGADKVPLRRLEPCPQPAQQQRQVRALRAVKGMEFIHHHVTQGSRRIALPQLAVARPQQQVIQHLVVGEQDVRRVLAQRLAIGNHTRWRHHHALPARSGLPAHIQAHAQARERRRFRHQLRKAPRLIQSQRVHRVNHQRLDALLPRLARAGTMVQHRIQEAFGLAAAGARRHQGACCRMTRRQPLPSGLLVAIPRKLGLKPLEKPLSLRAKRERQAHLQIRPLQPPRRVFHEARHQPVQKIIRRIETRDQELLKALLYIAGQEGRQHVGAGQSVREPRLRAALATGDANCLNSRRNSRCNSSTDGR